MTWFIVCLGVIIAAFVMWRDISPQLPKSLRPPASKSAAVTARPQTQATSDASAVGPSAWTVVASGRDFRASREFVTPVVIGSTTFYPPILDLSCYHGRLYAWMDTSLQAAPADGHSGRVAVIVDHGSPELWNRGSGTVIEAPHPGRLARDLLTRPSVTVSVTIVGAAEQSFELGTNGLQRLQPQITSCSPQTLSAGN
ncbi:MAG: hypothetical protein RB191_08165 [Terriglobia bacterium]|nr:hypothetical protein [Terriglobia bacterium]